MPSSAPGRRIYIGRLSPDATKKDVEQFFGDYGKLLDVRVMSGFGFIEFENLRDAEDAVHDFNGRNFMGERIIVEFAKAPRSVDPYREQTRRRPPSAPMSGRGGYRVIVTGLASDVSWQDLKDFARGAGQVTFADVSRDRPGEGVVEYTSKADADEALRKLDGVDLKGQRIRLDEDTSSRGRDREPDYRSERRRSVSPRRDDRKRSPPPRPRSPYAAGGRERDDEYRRRSPPAPRDYERRKSPVNGY